MIGAGPGERLPPFPPSTHSPGIGRSQRNGGLKPLTTARQALSVLDGRRRHPLHQPYLQPFQNPRAPWDGDKPLPFTVTCRAAESYHWSGLRQFTPREYALLQGFPLHHNFAGNYVKKQIGNAFPPIFVKMLYKHLVNWLDSQDNVVRVHYARVEDGAIPFRAPTAQRHINIEPKEDQEITFLSIHKRQRALYDSVELIDDDDGRVSSKKRARLNATPSRPKQKMVIDLNGDMSNLVLDLDQDQNQEQDDMDGRSDSATLRKPSVDSAQARARGSSSSSSSSSPPSLSTPFPASADSNSARNPPFPQRPAFSHHHHTPGGDRFFMSSPRPPHPLPSSPLSPSPTHTLPASSSSSSSSSSSKSNSMQGEKSVWRKLFFIVPPPRPEPFSSPSSTSSTSSSGTTSSSSSSSSDASKSPRNTTAAAAAVKKENQNIPLHVKGTKEEPMELSD